MTLSIVDPPASSTPTLSRSSSISGADTAGLHSSVLSQVHTGRITKINVHEVMFVRWGNPWCFINPQDDSLDHSLTAMNLSMSMGGTNVYEAARLSGGSSIMENLQSQLKLREGEIAQLQVPALNYSRATVTAQHLWIVNVFFFIFCSLRSLILRGLVLWWLKNLSD